MAKTALKTSDLVWWIVGIICAVSLWNEFYPLTTQNYPRVEKSSPANIRLLAKEIEKDPYIQEIDRGYQGLLGAEAFAEGWMFAKNLPELRKAMDKFPDRTNLKDHSK